MAVSIVRSLVTLAGAALAVALVALTAVHLVAPQRDGPLALSQILAPYLFLLLVPFLLLLRTTGTPGRLLRWAMAAAIVVFVVRFVPAWVPLPGAAPATAAGAERIGVATWNLELGQPEAAAVVDTIRAMDAAVLGLVELAPTCGVASGRWSCARPKGRWASACCPRCRPSGSRGGWAIHRSWSSSSTPGRAGR